MRGKRPKKRPIIKDPIYGSSQITKLINRIMQDGKKGVAQRHVYDALELIGKKTGKDPLGVFEDALRNITPQMEVRSRRVGGAAYQVPVPVRSNRGQALAARWLVMEANKRSSKEYHSFTEKLAAEIMDAYSNQGGAISRKQTTHKMAEANKAFAHFRW